MMRMSLAALILFVTIPAAALAQQEPQPAVARLMHYMDPLEGCFEAAESSAEAEACIGVQATVCMDTEESGYSTVGMMFCLLAEYHAWDRLLNSTYQSTMAGLREEDAQDRAAFDGRFGQRAESLRDAQRGWIAYKEGQCALEYALWGSGSMRQIAGADCQMQMTAERTIAIRFLGEAMR